jgi:hypothetical protein
MEWENLKERDRFEYLAVDGSVILSRKGTGSEGVSGFVCLTIGTI